MAERRAAHRRVDEATDRHTLRHELTVAHEELVRQNTELLRARATLEAARDRLAELYDFAPNGYLTLDRNGIIVQINLTGAAVLGRKRDVLEGMPLLGFTIRAHRERLLGFLRRCRTSHRNAEVVTELSLKTADGVRDMQLLCKPRPKSLGRQQFFAAMIDVTERRILEAQRDAAAHQHAALASRLISIQDEERQRIARDLHDDVGQQMTALRLLLDAIARAATNQQVRNRIAQAQSIVKHVDAQLDFLTGELRPAALDLGAVSAIRQFVEEWSNTFNIDAEFHCVGLEDLRLSGEAETHVYRVVQEALNNVAKHAQAAHVTIQLSRRDQMFVLTIADDGRGFEPSAHHDAHRGLGLLGMRERAHLVEGTLGVVTTPGKGTTIVLQVPASQPAETRGGGEAGRVRGNQSSPSAAAIVSRKVPR